MADRLISNYEEQITPSLKWVTDSQLEQIHYASLEVLERTGIVVKNEKRDVYEAEFSNLGLKGVEVEASYVKEFEKLLAGGIWCILKIDYYYDEDARNANPFIINSLKPIQIPNLDMDEILSGRKYFTKDEWIDVLLRSVGMEPTHLVRHRLLHYQSPRLDFDYFLLFLS
jgi:ATP-dependent Lon protease